MAVNGQEHAMKIQRAGDGGGGWGLAVGLGTAK